MMQLPIVTSISLSLVVCACQATKPRPSTPTHEVGDGSRSAQSSRLRDPREVRFGAVKQLTFGAENAEAYWSADGTQLIFQTNRPPFQCDQIMRMPADGSKPPILVSTGLGRTTCSYFTHDDKHILYASTHLLAKTCPTPPDRSQGYVWPLDDYEIFRARPDGSELVALTNSKGYDAEATVCPIDGSIVFTSVRDGDLELYRMDADGSNVKRLTHTPGYDGGPFFSPDCKSIVWRASRPEGAALVEYKRLLDKRLFRPNVLEIYVADADGSNPRRVTNLGVSSFAPYFFPSGKRIIFATDYKNKRGREFDLWAVNIDGTELERITYTPGFDGFPMFSPDGKKLAFSSNRNQGKPGETDVYVTSWQNVPGAIEKRSEDRYLQDVRWLAADERQGRGPGTEGLDTAAIWLEKQFRDIGLSPAFSEGFSQPLDVVASVSVHADTKLSIANQAIPKDQFIPASFSADVSIRGRTVFVRHGVVARELGVNDYRGKRVRGKIAVALRFGMEDESFRDPAVRRRYQDLRYRAFIARERGARGLIVVDVQRPKGHPSIPPDLPKLIDDPQGDVGIPVVVIDYSQGQKLLKGSHRVAMTVKLDRKIDRVKNIVGVIRSTHPQRKPQALIVGAHYDHLGWGGYDSRSVGVHEVHNGADDNASGVAALLTVARDLYKVRSSLKRDVYIAAFTAEELGILGSSHFVQYLPEALSQGNMFAMLNMDMVGRMRDGKLSVHGGESAVEWPAIVQKACKAAAVTCEVGGSGYGPSDHMPFYTAGVPVLHFTTGPHRDYHRPNDDTESILATGGIQVANIVTSVTRTVANATKRLTYRKATKPTATGKRGSWRASLGTIPSYQAGTKPGVLLDDVVPGGAAALAGLQRGDRIVKLAGSSIRSIHDLMYILRQATPGQVASITVVRDGKPVRLSVTFQTRRKKR